MFKNFRWQIASWFVSLSILIYLVFSVLGGMYFYNSVSQSMDEELRLVASHIGHAIELSNDRPTFRDWLRVVKTEPARSLISMQLFDSSGALLEHYGPIGIPKLINDKQAEASENGQTMRTFKSELSHNNKLVGYLQLQLSTAHRTELTKTFLMTMAVMAPFVFAAFGLCGYIVSGIASQPIMRLVRTLQRFVADAGHELNTPASIVQARADSLERKLIKQGLQINDVQIIASSAERMGYIVKNLMLLAELDTQPRPARNGPVDVKTITESVLSEFADRFEQKNIILRAGSLEQATVLADKESICCILTNLIENALKYTQSPGCVTVSCTVNSGATRIVVEDNGIGIPSDSLPFIFDRFYRIDKSRSRKSGGSGLGLSIVKAIVESLNGTVCVESVFGRGSRFQVQLPLHRGSVIAQDLHKSL